MKDSLAQSTELTLANQHRRFIYRSASSSEDSSHPMRRCTDRRLPAPARTTPTPQQMDILPPKNRHLELQIHTLPTPEATVNTTNRNLYTAPQRLHLPDRVVTIIIDLHV